MKNTKLYSILFLCFLIFTGCGKSNKVSEMKPEDIPSGNKSSEIYSSPSENYFQSEKLSSERDEIVRFFVGDDYRLFQYKVSEEYTNAVITAVHFQKGTNIAEKEIIKYSLLENGNIGRLAVYTTGDLDLIFTIGTDLVTQSRVVSLTDSFGLYADSSYPMSGDETDYAVQAGEKYPFYLITYGNEPETKSFDKIVEDSENGLENVEDCIIFYLQFD